MGQRIGQPDWAAGIFRPCHVCQSTGTERLDDAADRPAHRPLDVYKRQVPVFSSFIMVLPMVWSNVEQGIRQTDQTLLEMARCYRFSRWKLLKLVYIPSVLPYFQATLASGIGMAWKSGVAAEVLCVPAAGLGRDLYYAKIYFETPDLFAVTVTVVVLSLCMERLMMWCTPVSYTHLCLYIAPIGWCRRW